MLNTRVAVIGAGVQGRRHVEAIAAQPDATVVLVVDRDPRQAKDVAKPLGAAWAARVQLSDIDAAVVAVPTHAHFIETMRLLRANKHVLVEKPIAMTPLQGHALARTAHERGLALVVGHVERFNPALLRVKQTLRNPLHVTARRTGPRSSRILDDVVLDLMIHDLDLILDLAASSVVHVHSLELIKGPRGLDSVEASVRFASGLTASLSASRLGGQKTRVLEIAERRTVLRADLLTQEAARADLSPSVYGPHGVLTDRDFRTMPVARDQQLLQKQFRHFIECIADPTLAVAGTQRAIEALRLARLIGATRHGAADDHSSPKPGSRGPQAAAGAGTPVADV